MEGRDNLTIKNRFFHNFTIIGWTCAILLGFVNVANFELSSRDFAARAVVNNAVYIGVGKLSRGRRLRTRRWLVLEDDLWPWRPRSETRPCLGTRGPRFCPEARAGSSPSSFASLSSCPPSRGSLAPFSLPLATYSARLAGVMPACSSACIPHDALR